MEKDFFNGFKLAEFSVFDSSEKHLLYRIESYYVVGGKIQLIDISSKQIIGKLTNSLNLLLYEGNFSIFNFSSHQWIDGNIQRIFNLINEKYLIKWNDKTIIMETKFGSLTTTFQYEFQNEILAKIQKRSIAFIWSNKYDLHLFSNQFPDAIYFLSIAVKDQNNRIRYKG
jgi:hypothetical protein